MAPPEEDPKVGSAEAGNIQTLVGNEAVVWMGSDQGPFCRLLLQAETCAFPVVRPALFCFLGDEARCRNELQGDVYIRFYESVSSYTVLCRAEGDRRKAQARLLPLTSSESSRGGES